VPLAEM